MAVQNIHTTMIHAKCPISQCWDYYTLRIITVEFIKAEELDAIANGIRGCHLTQEDIADKIAERLPTHCKIELSGQHGQNQGLEAWRWGTKE